MISVIVKEQKMKWCFEEDKVYSDLVQYFRQW